MLFKQNERGRRFEVVTRETETQRRRETRPPRATESATLQQGAGGQQQREGWTWSKPTPTRRRGLFPTCSPGRNNS